MPSQLHCSPLGASVTGAQSTGAQVTGVNATASPRYVVSHAPFPDACQTYALSLGYPAVSLGLMTGLFSVAFVLLGLRIRRLTRLVQRRDHQIVTLSAVDPLTGLANRKQLDAVGSQLLAASPRVEVALLYINLDGFKAVNDALGHGAGDELLLRVSQRLQACKRPKDTLSRLGGDEFALLLRWDDARQKRLCRREHICQYAEHLLKVLSEPFEVYGQPVSITGSLGMALATKETTAPLSFGHLLSQADIAMSQAKRARAMSKVMPDAPGKYTQGKCVHSHYALFHPLMQSEVVAQALLRRELKAAIVRQELRVHYQPIVDLRTSRTVGFEALVRWQHAVRGLLPPSAFLPQAEEMGLTVSIDRWVMEAACRQLSIWSRPPFLLQLSLSVNLSAAHLAEPDLVEYVQQLLSQYAIKPYQLNLEITESVMIADPERVIDTLGHLKKLGLSVSLDDFGTGYSSLGYLHQFPVDVLKIDRSFVSCLGPAGQRLSHVSSSAVNSSTVNERANERAGVNERAGSAFACSSEDTPDQVLGYTPDNRQRTPAQEEVIVQAIVDLARGLNIRVVAEGIERDDQRLQLRQMHCSYGQGNFFSEPLDGLTACELLRSACA